MKTVQVQLAASAAYASSRLFTCSVQCSDFGSDNACHPVQKSLVRICDMMQISFSIDIDLSLPYFVSIFTHHYGFLPGQGNPDTPKPPPPAAPAPAPPAANKDDASKDSKDREPAADAKKPFGVKGFSSPPTLHERARKTEFWRVFVNRGCVVLPCTLTLRSGARGGRVDAEEGYADCTQPADARPADSTQRRCQALFGAATQAVSADKIMNEGAKPAPNTTGSTASVAGAPEQKEKPRGRSASPAKKRSKSPLRRKTGSSHSPDGRRKREKVKLEEVMSGEITQVLLAGAFDAEVWIEMGEQRK
eukprot:3521747-Rhodomonas_salina.2